MRNGKGLPDFFERYIKGTPPRSVIVEKKILLCHLSTASVEGAGIVVPRVYVTSRALKHLYDKKPAEEFDTIIKYLYKIIRQPDEVFENKKAKRGSICVTKVVKGNRYFCSLEMVELVNAVGTEIQELQIVTVFRIRSDSYLKSYRLLWSWRDGKPHRNTFDTRVN